MQLQEQDGTVLLSAAWQWGRENGRGERQESGKDLCDAYVQAAHLMGTPSYPITLAVFIFIK